MQRIKSRTYKGRRHLPLPTGPFAVGCCDIMNSYSKCGVFVRLYYPSNADDILDRYLQWPLWMPQKQYLIGHALKRGVAPCFYKCIYKLLVGNLYIPAVWQADLGSFKEKYPVVVLSHGLSGWRAACSSICLELASYGFIVAAVEHRDHSASASFYKKQLRMSTIGPIPGSSLCDLDIFHNVLVELDLEKSIRADIIKNDSNLLTDDIGPACYTKEWILYQCSVKGNELHFRNQQLKYRAKECSEVLDLLEDLNLGKSLPNILDPHANTAMFKNKLDLTKAFLIGHSFGAATAVLCLATERFRAGILLDPWMYPFFKEQSSFNQICQPFLCVVIKSSQSKGSQHTLKNLQTLRPLGKFAIMRKVHHQDLCDVSFASKFSFSPSSKFGSRIEKFSALDLYLDLILQYLGQYTGGCSRACSRKLVLLREKCISDDFRKL